MQLIAPSYYPHFRCLADKCRHTCCAGWEIDIDEDSFHRYQQLPGLMGDELRTHMVVENDTAHFCLDAEERCPFLLKNGLCRLICQLGEESICQVCADHPRFRNFFADRTEIGLGLCCEAAALLVLQQDDPVRLMVVEDDHQAEEQDVTEQEIRCFRDQWITAVQNRRFSMEERVAQLTAMLSFPALQSFSSSEWESIYQTLEVLDPAWTAQLSWLHEPTQPLDAAWEIPFEQLLVYLLYRHVSPASDEADFEERAAFALLSWQIIRHLFAAQTHHPRTLPLLADLARMYSAEIEYSDENIDALIEAIVTNEKEQNHVQLDHRLG